jgi:CO/xanthine dehydrogenase Mo-binding subunit
MRDEETAWDTKGPAYVMKMRGGLDAQGNLLALDYEAIAADYCHLGYNEFDTVLIAQLTGRRKQTPAAGAHDVPDDMYAVPNRRMAGHVVSLPLVWETPLRTGNLRDPNGPQVTFASESFIDELAAAAKADPVEFRLRLLTNVRGAGPTASDALSVRGAGSAASDRQDRAADPPLSDDSGFKRARSIAVVKAAAEKFGWTPRPSPAPRTNGEIATGRGFAYTYRNQTVVANAVEVEVNRRTGRVWVKRLVCAHDCGLVINPAALRGTIEGGVLHGLSRALYEEVTFDAEKITSVDWRTSPTLTHTDTPAQIDVVLVNGDPNQNRPDLPHYGAGEAALKPMIAAVANAIYDATGVRMRRAPFKPARVVAALKASAV